MVTAGAYPSGPSPSVPAMEQRLRPLSEDECYLRCYGWRGADDTVKVVPTGNPHESASPAALTERIRLAFEARLDEREPEAA